MINNKIKPRQALSKAFLRIKPIRNEFEIFKRNLITLLNQIDENEREEFHKNILTDFLKNTYYGADYLINIKASNDLVIYNGKDTKSNVGVILEAKKVNNNEMLKVDNLNTKALQQLFLYFLRERITNKNSEIKYLIATNIYEWFIFDATLFENLFAQNRQLVKQFTDFEEKRLSNSRTDFFYKEIAQPAIDKIQNELIFTHYDIKIENDELIITDDDGKFFTYNPKNPESRRIQETLFHEKQTIIENCLFGVDINPNSVKICRLRLWIELLKNAYYKTSPLTPLLPGEGNIGELETLPNIDINIKIGNSLISRFPLNCNLRTILKKSDWNIESYRNAIKTYLHPDNKDQKQEMERLINDIKGNIRTEISSNDPNIEKRNQKIAELRHLRDQKSLFAESKAEAKNRQKKQEELEQEINELNAEIEEKKSGKLYQNAFEWRFEFPEVLNDDGDFIGFDVMIGNPPYISLSKIKEKSQTAYFENNYQTHTKGSDIYCLFYEKGSCLLRKSGFLTYITSNSWLKTIYGDSLKKYLIENLQPQTLLNIEDMQIFEEATVESNIIILKKDKVNEFFDVAILDNNYLVGSSLDEYFDKNCFQFIIPNTSEWIIGNRETVSLKQKIEQSSKLLKEFDININRGLLTGLNAAFIINEETKNQLIAESSNSAEIIQPILRGRDLKKYSYEFSGFYLINTHNGVAKNNIERIKVKENYPSIYNYLISFLPQIEQRQDQGKDWTNLRNCAYLDDFEKPKIVWGEISDQPKFAFDDSNYYVEATAFLMTGEKLKYLLAILNSKLSEWYFNQISTTTGMGTNRWKKYKIEMLPIKEPTETEELLLEKIVNQILTAKKSDPKADTTALETEIDQLVYQLYELTAEEIKIIEE